MGFRGKKVLVTGADGFIGSHVAEALVREGADLRAFCFYNSNGSYGWLDHIDQDVARSIDFRLGDIRDATFVERCCQDVEVVFHLAALVSIPYSYQATQSFIDTNVSGTLNVLNGVLRHECRRLVHTSTSEVYGTPDELPIRETHPLQGQSPYSASKISADKLCEAYHCSFSAPVVTLRPFNTYGPRQSKRAVIPTILEQLLRGAKEVELGNIKPRRDLTYVADTVSGFLAAGLGSDCEGRTIQLGTGRAESIEEIFRAACKVLGVQATIVTGTARVRPTKSEVMVLQSDPTLAKQLLGWEAKVSLEEGLDRSAAWIRDNLHRYRSGTYEV